jgi:hypothetical protein
MPALSTRGDPTVLAQPAVTWKRVMREGATVGMLGASAVAVWFLLVDAMAGEPFRTPALLARIIRELPPHPHPGPLPPEGEGAMSRSLAPAGGEGRVRGSPRRDHRVHE